MLMSLNKNNCDYGSVVVTSNGMQQNENSNVSFRLSQRSRPQQRQLALLLIVFIFLAIITARYYYYLYDAPQLATTSKALSSSSSNIKCPVVKWSDEFDNEGASLQNWEFDNGNGCDIGLCGWGNNELEEYTTDNVEVSNGTLKIIAQQQEKENAKKNNDNAGFDNENYRYTSSRIRSKFNVVYGRMEARMRLPLFYRGIWPAFWMLPAENVYGGWPASGEIDIVEGLGYEHSTIHGTIHYAGNRNEHAWLTQSVNLLEGQLFVDKFHEFAIEWTAEKIQWFLDGSVYFQIHRDDIQAHPWPFDQRFHFILNLAIGGNWPGYPDETTKFPQTMEVDYIRAYQAQEGASSLFGYLDGPSIVEREQKGLKYTIQQGLEDYTYVWEVPDGANFSASATDINNNIVVDFGAHSGNVKVEATSVSCGVTRVFSIPVKVNPAYSPEFMLVHNGQGIQVALRIATGSYTVVKNPSMTEHEQTLDDPLSITNLSSRVIRYVRGRWAEYDTIFYRTLSIPNPEDYVYEKRRFYIDVYSNNVPPGTKIWLFLENSHASNTNNYPTGRHSRYEAVIAGTKGSNTTSFSWVRLPFNLLDRPDLDETKVDSIVILFNPGQRLDHTFFFDNLESYLVRTY